MKKYAYLCNENVQQACVNACRCAFRYIFLKRFLLNPKSGNRQI